VTFRSKIDWWIVALASPGFVVVPVVIAIVAMHRPLPQQAVVAIVILLLVLLALLSTFTSTYYRIEGDELLIRSGLFRWRVPIEAIESIEPTRDPWSSPALSLDRLRIHYRKNGGGSDILISPDDKEGFIAAVRAVNPTVRA